MPFLSYDDVQEEEDARKRQRGEQGTFVFALSGMVLFLPKEL